MVFKENVGLNVAETQKECMEHASTRRCQPETSFFEPHGFSPYQQVFGRDPELAFDVLVPGADVAAVTMPVLDPGSTTGFCGESG